MAETSTALKFSSPVHVIRPLDDVHANCKQDVESICNSINTNLNNELMSDAKNYQILEDLHLEEKTDEHKWQTIDEQQQPRRLSEIGADTAVLVPVSRSYSIKVGLRVTPKSSKGLVDDQRVKDNQRFLNYGRETDTCLWNAFDVKRVSSQCASSLQRVNEIMDYPTMKYSGESEYVKRTSITVSIPLVSVIFILISCMFLRQLWNNEEDDDDDDTVECSDDEYEVDADYHILDESELIAHIAVPLKVI